MPYVKHTPATYAEIQAKLALPVPFLRPGGTDCEFWACGNCGEIKRDELSARRCYHCFIPPCGTEGCDALVERPYTVCRKHREEHRRQKTIDAFRKATIVTDQTNEPAFSPSDDDGWWHGGEVEVYDDAERLVADGRFPRFVWCARTIRPSLDVDTLLEHMLSDAPDEYEHDVVDQPELEAFLKEWAEKQTVSWYEPDYTRARLLEPPKWEEYGTGPEPEDWPSWDVAKIASGEEDPI